MCCAADDHSILDHSYRAYMCHTCAQEFQIRNSIKQLLTKYQIFAKLPKFHINCNFLKYIYNFLDQLLHPYKFHGRDMSGILFFIFASCELLIALGVSLPYVGVTGVSSFLSTMLTLPFAVVYLRGRVPKKENSNERYSIMYMSWSRKYDWKFKRFQNRYKNSVVLKSQYH